MQDVAHQHGRFVIEVVAGDDRVIAAPAGCLVEQVPLGEAARRAGCPLGGPAAVWHVEPVVAQQVLGMEREVPGVGNRVAYSADTSLYSPMPSPT